MGRKLLIPRDRIYRRWAQFESCAPGRTNPSYATGSTPLPLLLIAFSIVGNDRRTQGDAPRRRTATLRRTADPEHAVIC